MKKNRNQARPGLIRMAERQGLTEKVKELKKIKELRKLEREEKKGKIK